jgi:calcineurin-like phosphoesterase family protein
MDIWFTSDWHLNHRNIIEYCNRPFEDVVQMNLELIDRFNAAVKPGDLVYDLGDFSMNDKVVPWAMKRLNGKRVLIPGNHDRCYRKHRGFASWSRQYVEWGFAEVRQAHELEIDGKSVRLDHMPYSDDLGRHEKYAEYRPKDDGRWLLCGHVHGAWAERERMVNVGVDVRGYKPIHIDEVAKLIASAS